MFVDEGHRPNVRATEPLGVVASKLFAMLRSTLRSTLRSMLRCRLKLAYRFFYVFSGGLIDNLSEDWK